MIFLNHILNRMRTCYKHKILQVPEIYRKILLKIDAHTPYQQLLFVLIAIDWSYQMGILNTLGSAVFLYKTSYFLLTSIQKSPQFFKLIQKIVKYTKLCLKIDKNDFSKVTTEEAYNFLNLDPQTPMHEITRKYNEEKARLRRLNNEPLFSLNSTQVRSLKVYNFIFFRNLDLEYNTGSRSIKKAYRKLALKYHPDKREGQWNEQDQEKWQSIQDSYKILMSYYD